MKLTQEDYDTIVFLARLVYYDLEYPKPFECKAKVELFSGLKLNMFDMGDYDLVVICGTNSIRDWIANFKVALGTLPKQYLQAYYEVKNRLGNHGRPIVVAGHSLGGGCAEYVASSLCSSDITCLTFNGCGCKHLIYPTLRDVNTYNVITHRDVLNRITLHIPFAKNYMQHTGKEFIIKDTDGFFPLSVKSHCNFARFADINVDDFYK